LKLVILVLTPKRRVAGVVRAHLAVITLDGGAAHADPIDTRVQLCARVLIVTRQRVGDVKAPDHGVARLIRAGVLIVTRLITG
jgi:hypothetical protein